ncbi:MULTISPECIES: murein hydrolase activator EnvC family protein [Lysinibacillus]|uniref:murein hydrolase activator EnvC family protein n=1 Tax=Lysinibacillus TaxID=400634 RepID=UPI0021A85A07|nr:M23 family metallopeptidase [Lysinibacillus capsici]MCT1541256.1 peptidoglycan DD-metalloendopeptidase family protein [Lysinibacillus capsici]MCT1572472.1 peptidoglycan DD-metalloendopeptidase family protein [Lysinibacillus capsici]MCT1649637.1 peptidoglycan DD-metalloendopeptidase family protein [Lysinibacillus capsici]MCT1728116.1 peptidoglycan DD-metalloendopeptidase family protein [Lysinibacillus capsici]MCT1785819.1 peptidoglycan DD-metalloendopeptidase family protein [Lysinibacillus c
MKSKAKNILKTLAAASALILFIQTPSAYATSLSDLKEEKKQVETKKNQLNSSISNKSNAITANQEKQQQILDQIQALNAEIDKTNSNIKKVQADIRATNEEIKKLEASIEELLHKIEERDLLLQERARAIQAGGSVSYLDVLLGSNSFVDFIDRFSAVNALLEADRQIIQDQKDDKQKLEEQKQSVEEKRKNLEGKKAELERLKASLDSQKTEKNKLVDQLEKEQEKLKSEKVLLEKEYSEALEVSQELQDQIIAEQNRLAEIARQQEAKRKAAAAAAAAVAANNGGGSSGGTVHAPQSNGTWIKPTNGRLTSPYGWRNLGAGPEFHYGVDLANATGTPIWAAADGVVSYAAPLSSYGNVVIVTHSIDGQIYTTVYAHLSAFNVSVGQEVTQGQQIAAMGSTGRSTGPHLHFEVHIGPWKGQAVGSVNPLKYIPL